MAAVIADERRREKVIYRVTVTGSVCNLGLVAFKFVAGIVGRSDAMLADAIHSLSDFITDIIVLLFVRISAKPQDSDHHFGHGKYETLATALVGLMLLGVGLGILWKSSTAIISWWQGNELTEPGWLALIAALVSIAVKEVLYQYTARAGRRIGSQVVIANAWHHRSDALSSIATAVGIGGAILLGAKWRVLDPLAALLVSLLIVRVAWRLLVPCVEELMEKSLPPDTEEAITRTLTDVLADCDPHNMRTRRIGSRSAVDVHVRMDGEMTVNQSHEVTRLMEERLRAILGPDAFISIHVEPTKGPKATA